MKKGDKVIIADIGESFTSYNTLAEDMGAKKWREGYSARNGRAGVIKGIRIADERRIALVDVGSREILIGVGGLQLTDRSLSRTKAKQKRKPKRKKKVIKPVIYISAKVFNVLGRALKNFLKRYGNIGDNHHYPYCFLLGRNRNNILVKTARLKRAGDRFHDECSNMINIETSVIAKASMKLYKEHAIPCGLARVGSFSLNQKFGTRGSSLNEVGRMGGFILSMTKEAIKVERAISGRNVETYKCEIVMNGKKDRKKSKKGRR